MVGFVQRHQWPVLEFQLDVAQSREREQPRLRLSDAVPPSIYHCVPLPPLYRPAVFAYLWRYGSGIGRFRSASGPCDRGRANDKFNSPLAACRAVSYLFFPSFFFEKRSGPRITERLSMLYAKPGRASLKKRPLRPVPGVNSTRREHRKITNRRRNTASGPLNPPVHAASSRGRRHSGARLCSLIPDTIR